MARYHRNMFRTCCHEAFIPWDYYHDRNNKIMLFGHGSSTIWSCFVDPTYRVIKSFYSISKVIWLWLLKYCISCPVHLVVCTALNGFFSYHKWSPVGMSHVMFFYPALKAILLWFVTEAANICLIDGSASCTFLDGFYSYLSQLISCTRIFIPQSWCLLMRGILDDGIVKSVDLHFLYSLWHEC